MLLALGLPDKVSYEEGQVTTIVHADIRLFVVDAALDVGITLCFDPCAGCLACRYPTVVVRVRRGAA